MRGEISTRFSLNRHLVKVHKLEKDSITDEDLRLLEIDEEEEVEVQQEIIPKKEEVKLSKLFICTDCFPPNSFTEIASYIAHKKRSHGKDSGNISVKELAPVYVPSVNVFDRGEQKASIMCKNCSPPLPFTNTTDFMNHVNLNHQDTGEMDSEVIEAPEDLEEKKRWECSECSASYSRRINLQNHLKEKHGKILNLDIVQCPECEECFPSNRQVIQHGITIHQKYFAELHNQYKRNILKIREKQIGRDKKFECDFCQRKYLMKEPLRRHILKDHLKENGDESAMCSYCGKTLTNKANLKSHIEFVHEALFVSCPICQKKINFKTIGRHYKRHQSKEEKLANKLKYLCNLCGKVLHSKMGFASHQKMHDNIRDHVCETCGEGFFNRRCLYTHKKIHEGPSRKVYKCDKCDKVFNGKQSLKRHELTHSGTKDFICEMCSKTFYTIQELKRHLRYHKKEYRFNCQLCEMKFFDKSRFRNHMMRHRNIRPHKCDFCDKVFILRRKMNLHMAARHNYQVRDTRGVWKDPKTYVPLDDLL